jgi:hypothetical protein
MSPRGRYWCFTLNNPTPLQIRALTRAVENHEDLLYICWGKEVGESGTPHLQGYLELAAKLRLNSVRKLGGLGTAHLEVRKGSQAQAIEYCQKDGEFTEFGSKVSSTRGKRNDLLAIRARLDEGANQLEIAEEYFGSWCRYRKSFSAYQGLRHGRTSRDVRVHAISGLPGTGKTRIVFEKEPSLYICASSDLQWFDGYDGEEAILIDDYRGGADVSFLLRFLDRYPVQLPVKGGYTPLLATRIYITSNEGPVWGHHADYAAISRRLHHCMTINTIMDFDNTEAIDKVWEKLHTYAE